jgi:hypothetical protein
MGASDKKPKERKIGKNETSKKHLIDPRYTNLIWTSITVIVLLVFFIINNTRTEPEQGPYPPYYNASGNQTADSTSNTTGK